MNKTLTTVTRLMRRPMMYSSAYTRPSLLSPIVGRSLDVAE
jgi:hypothetical protein